MNGSCKAASLRCDLQRGQRRKQQADAEDELHLGPKGGSLATSGSLRGTFSPNASSVAGVACGSLATSGPSRERSLRVLRKLLVLRAVLWRLLSRVAGPSSSSMSKIRSSACPSTGPLRHLRVLCRRVWAVRAQAVAWCIVPMVLPLRRLRPRSAAKKSFSVLFDRCISPSQRVAHVSDCHAGLCMVVVCMIMHIGYCM